MMHKCSLLRTTGKAAVQAAAALQAGPATQTDNHCMWQYEDNRATATKTLHMKGATYTQMVQTNEDRQE
jgi:hypothetical protein